MLEFIVFSDIQFYNNPNRRYIRDDGLSSWLWEQLRIVEQIFQYAVDNNVKMVIFNGDLFEEKNNINTRLYNRVWELFYRWSEFLRIVMNTGNHDFYTLSRDSSLKPFSTFAEIASVPSDLPISGPYVVRLIPYGMVTEDTLQRPEGYEKCILFTHEEINGLTLGPTDFSKDTNLTIDMFSEWDVVFNGHIHKPQDVGNIVNIGSPMIQDFGEAGETKRFIHYRDGEIKSIKIDCPQFVILDGLNDRILKVISEDDRNFYRIDIDSTEIGNPIFDKFNVIPNIVKSRKREDGFWGS